MKINRRRFLMGASGCLLPLPLLTALTPRTARAGGGMPSRALWWFNPNGHNPLERFCTGKGSHFVLPKSMQAFEAYRDRMTVIDGLRLHGCLVEGSNTGHTAAAAGWLTSTNLNPDTIEVGTSIDQKLADRWEGMTPFRSLELGMEQSVMSSGSDITGYTTSISWSDATTMRPKTIDPSALFVRLFGSDLNLDPKEAKRRLAVRQSVLDGVLDDLSRLNGALPSSDREKLEQYTTAIRELEGRIAASGALSCDPGDPAVSVEEFPDRLDQFLDLMVLAFECDLTRIVTFMLGSEGTNQPYSWAGVSEAHHGLSHHAYDADILEQITAIDTWQAEVFASFLDRLDARTDPLDPMGGSLLDTTVLMFGGGMEEGYYHDNTNLPTILFGGTSAFVHGQRVVLEDGPLADVHLAMCAAVGEDLGSHGVAGTGPMAGLS